MGSEWHMRHALALPFLPLVLVACQQVESPPASPAPAEEFFMVDDYARLDKIDLHAHIHGEDGELIQRTREDRFWFVNIAVHDADENKTSHSE